MIEQDPSLKEVIDNLIEEICEELAQEDGDCMMYSISSQVCPAEQGNFKVCHGIDLEDIFNENSISARPTPKAKKYSDEYLKRYIYKSLPKNKSEE